MKLRPGILLSTCVATGLCLGVPASAQEDVAAFYRGKQLRMLVGTGAGGGYDLFARAVARHIVDHIPGNPTIIVQNQPAAGGLVMVNQLYSLGPKDGTVIAAPINGIPTAPLLEPAAARFDAARLNWIGSTNRETYVAYAWHMARVRSLAELLQKELIVWRDGPRHHAGGFSAGHQQVPGNPVPGRARLRQHAADQCRHGARRGGGHRRHRLAIGQDHDPAMDRGEEDHGHCPIRPAAGSRSLRGAHHARSSPRPMPTVRLSP